MEQAQGKRFTVSFVLKMRTGQLIHSPIRVCDTEIGAKDFATSVSRDLGSAPRDYIEFLGMIGINEIGVNIVSLPGDDERTIIPPTGIILK
jgi:hypothetical protein